MLLATPALQICDAERVSPDVVDQLAARYEFYPYRHWLGFGRGVPQQLLRWQLLHRQAGDGSLMLALDGEEPVGLAWVAPMAWESRQLGRRMVELRALLAVGEPLQRRGIAQALLAALRGRLRETADCVVHRVDLSDIPTIGSLETQGAVLVDTVVSFIRGREFLPHLRRVQLRGCEVRPYREEDRAAVEEIAQHCYFGGRLYHDARCPRPAVDALYREWVRLSCQKVFADDVVVVSRRGQVGGFLAYQFQRWCYESVQLRVMGRGLLAVAPAHKGLALPLIRGAILRDPDSADFVQFDIHLDNLELLRLYGRLLRMSVAHIRHVFHWWLTPPSDPLDVA